MEALRSYKEAFLGLEFLLGRRHFDTLRPLTKIVFINNRMHRYTEMLRLSDKICMEQEFVRELNLKKDPRLQCSRYYAYHRMDDHDRETHMKK